jgi:hypothetical protein
MPPGLRELRGSSRSDLRDYRGSANTYTALAPLVVSASGVTTVCVAAIGPPPDVMAMN